MRSIKPRSLQGSERDSLEDQHIESSLKHAMCSALVSIANLGENFKNFLFNGFMNAPLLA